MRGLTSQAWDQGLDAVVAEPAQCHPCHLNGILNSVNLVIAKWWKKCKINYLPSRHCLLTVVNSTNGQWKDFCLRLRHPSQLVPDESYFCWSYLLFWQPTVDNITIYSFYFFITRVFSGFRVALVKTTRDGENIDVIVIALRKRSEKELIW